jgi:uncharacterized protein
MSETRANRLASEKSPYLLAHAHHPIDWYPWCDEAFVRAMREDKPIFLSIGYAACHWCHVMERESFKDESVAALLNESFIAVKVDREERPDIDGLYMRACQLLTGGGGWPLSIVMTPDKIPFFAATYIPKQSSFGRAGLLDLLPRIRELWRDRRGEIMNVARGLAAAWRAQAAAGERDAELGPDDLRLAVDALAESFDARNGGFGAAPKFPAACPLLFLLRYHRRTGDAHALEMVARTLDKMADGGIHDHVGGGFHRYATDAAWTIPHFEKMLPDQALLAIAFTEAFQVTGNEEYARIAQRTIGYVLRELQSPEGGFQCSEGAESPEGEGRFYLWTMDDIRKVLPPEDATLLITAFGIERKGNVLPDPTEGLAAGANILRLREPLPKLAERRAADPQEFRASIDRALSRLFDERAERPRPNKDDKILADWNGLMIAALAKASRAFGEGDFSLAAERAADFILTRMRTKDGRLLHRYRDGDASVTGFADDYAFLAWGLLELYQAATSRPRCSRISGMRKKGGSSLSPTTARCSRSARRSSTTARCRRRMPWRSATSSPLLRSQATRIFEGRLRPSLLPQRRMCGPRRRAIAISSVQPRGCCGRRR